MTLDSCAWEPIDRSSTNPWLPALKRAFASPVYQHSIPHVAENRELAQPTRTSIDHGDDAVRMHSEWRHGKRIADTELPAVEGYEILAKLGHGGMGVVYKARQQRLSRFVALKMIRAGSLAKPEDLARFRIEAEAVAKQRHPNIIQIFDIGEAGGLPFVALELLEGGSLDAFLAGTPQPAEASARLSATLARAIHAAHQAGIIHRDLKPSNVMFAIGRNAQNHRFRSGQAARGRGIHRNGAGAGLAELHSAGASTRTSQGGRTDGRCLCARGDPLRDVDRPAPVQGEDAGGNRHAGPQ